ncbi:MAG: insulinase family protein [Alphaproteobacteria bacterium]|nr:insulinase family protein [Alphaproteobacteria bacterium]
MITCHVDTVETTAFAISTQTGSRHENESNQGIAHFMEHIMAGKTRDGVLLSKIMDDIGWWSNAATWKHQTAYYGKGLADGFAKAFEVIAHQFLGGWFPDEEVEKERKVIFEEIGLCHDDNSRWLGRNSFQTSYPDQPFGRQALGTKETVTAITAQDMSGFWQKNYHPENTLISIAGKFDRDKAVDLAQRLFGGWSNPNTPEIPVPAVYKGGVWKEKRDQLTQAEVILSMQGVPYIDPDYLPLALGSSVLGGGGNSRLNKIIREDNRLVYYIGSGTSNFSDTGMFEIDFTTSLENLEKVLKLSCQLARDLPGSLTKEEIDNVKLKFKRRTFETLESISSVCWWYHDQVVRYGKIITPQEKYLQYQAITAEQVDAAFRKMLGSKLTYSIIGPEMKEPDYAAVCGWLGS